MVKGFSKVIIMGNLTRDPETRATQSGTSVTSFSVAVSRSYRNNNTGENVDEVSYFDCTAWGRTGETIAKWLHRGSGIIVSGRLRQHTWDDEKTGQKRSRVEIVVEDFNFVGGRSDDANGGNYDGGNYAGGAAKAKSGGKKAKDAGGDVLPDDIELDKEAEIDLEGVPF